MNKILIIGLLVMLVMSILLVGCVKTSEIDGHECKTAGYRYSDSPAFCEDVSKCIDDCNTFNSEYVKVTYRENKICYCSMEGAVSNIW